MFKKFREFFSGWQLFEVSILISVFHELGYRQTQRRILYVRRRRKNGKKMSRW
jgi:hypothetical protein